MPKSTHERHESARRGFEEQHVKKGFIRARGTLAYARVYEGGATKPRERKAWLMEWKHPSGHWLTCKAPETPATLAGALNMARASEGMYRVVTRDAFGGYRVLRLA